MKRILSILLVLIMLSLTACGATPNKQTEADPPDGERTEEYESVCVDIGVHDDGYYGLMANQSITTRTVRSVG